MIHREEEELILEVSYGIYTMDGNEARRERTSHNFGTNLNYDEAMKFLASGECDEKSLFTIIKQEN